MSAARDMIQIEERAAPAPVPAPASETSAVMAMIERAARDPSVDIDKLERLMAMRDRMTADAAKRAYDAALSEMQPELPEVERNGKITINDKNDRQKVIQSTPYALFEDINAAIKPILAKHGFAVSFRTGQTPEGKIIVTGILSHREGHREETSMILQHDSTGSKNAVQAIGSSTSYGKRYTLCALLNISTRGEDDDGKAGGAEGAINPDQVSELQGLIMEYGVDLPRFLGFLAKTYKAESLEAVQAKDFPAILARLKQKAPR